MENTSQKVFSNMMWRFFERTGAYLVQFVVSIILARILGPEAYGTIALVTVFITILQVFVESGLGSALIQKKNADDIDYSTVFYTSIVFCLILYLLLFFLAPLIARFYEDESLTLLTRVLGLTIVISGVKNVQQAYVSKHLLFKKFFFSTLIGTIGAAIIGIWMAYNGYGVWALVTQQLFNLFVDMVVLWITIKWRPIKAFSFKRLKGLFSYGWKLLASSLLETAYNNLCQLIIGKVYSSSDLAFYNKGRQMPNLIINNINSSIDSVLLPTMSREQDDRVRVRDMTRRSIKTSIYIMAPLMMGLAFTGSNVILVLLTDKWLGAVPYLYIFCITSMFYPVHTANLNAIKAMGRSDIFLKLEIIKKIIGIILLVITMRISVMAMAYSLLFMGFFSQLINSYPNKKLLDYGYLSQLKDIFPSILLACFMGAIVYLVNFISLSPIITLIIQVILGVVVYTSLSMVLKIDSFIYILNILKGLLRKRRKA